MNIISYKEVLETLSMKDAIQVMKNCFLDYQAGNISQNKRSVEILPDGKDKNIFAMMPAYLGKDRVFGAKLITAFPDNVKQQLPSHLGEIILFDSQIGSPLAMIDANAVTWIRTAAVSALATDYLARTDATSLALIGAGQQASSHLATIACIRELKTVFVYDLNDERKNELVATFEQDYPNINFISSLSAKEAVATADIICTLTPSKEAFLEKDWIQPGTHINAIGTFTPTTREITSDLISSSSLYIDDYEAIFNESGDFLIPLAEGKISKEDIIGSLGELATGKATSRKLEQEVTIFDAVGLAVEDLCCAEYIYNQTKEGN